MNVCLYPLLRWPEIQLRLWSRHFLLSKQALKVQHWRGGSDLVRLHACTGKSTSDGRLHTWQLIMEVMTDSYFSFFTCLLYDNLVLSVFPVLDPFWFTMRCETVVCLLSKLILFLCPSQSPPKRTNCPAKKSIRCFSFEVGTRVTLMDTSRLSIPVWLLLEHWLGRPLLL